MIHFLLKQRVLFLIFLAWGGTLFFLSSRPITVKPPGFEIPHADKIVHFGYFFIGAFIFTLLLSKFFKKSIIRFFFISGLFLIIGILDEYHQTFTPGRSGNDPFDILADILGAMTAAIVAGFLIKHTRLKPTLQNC